MNYKSKRLGFAGMTQHKAGIKLRHASRIIHINQVKARGHLQASTRKALARKVWPYAPATS